jgi:glycosyltransferase involved in cell wall biosynthesis
MSSPVISIVLPTYNGSRYIRQSIDSCLAQTFTDFELIVVNDCSTDDTLQILEEYAKKDRRVTVINNAFNKKLPQSLNTGFEVAKGAFFTWTSDDNYYAPTALQAMLKALESNREADLVYADYTLIDENDTVTGTRCFGDINKSFHHWLGCGACFLYKKKVHRKNNGYKPEAFLIEDYEFFVRAYTQNNFVYLPLTNLYYYREHSASLTATQNTFINDISKLFLERNLPSLEKKLPQTEKALLYRKFAVYFAVQKNNREKYKLYLDKLSFLSKSQTLKTAGYVFAQKLGYAFTVGVEGLFYALGRFRKKKSRQHQ